jgi:FkbM family methyltransferase
MNKLIIFLYSILPKKTILFLGRSRLLKKLRNTVLRPNNKDVVISLFVKWGKGGFHFFASPKVVVKAKNKGIENTLLKNALFLFDKFSISTPTIIDVGANYGFISLALSTNLSKDSIVFSFEPHPQLVEAFKKSILKNNIKNIHLENVAVGDLRNRISLNLMGQTSNILDTGIEVVEKIEIDQIFLDDYFLSNQIKPDFVKIDVDGYELNVLKGMKNTIAKYLPILVVESNGNHEIIDFLKQYDYDLFDLNLSKFEGIPNNIFCVKRN